MVERLIIKVRINKTISGFATYTYKQHHGIRADILARKLGIVIYNTNSTLQSTAHNNLRSDLKPLIWRYRRYFLSQRLRQLGFRFYTNTLFAKDKCKVGNICDHIFTDGWFVQIIPMRYKSEADTTLDRINRGVGVVNKVLI